jgi:hypothetical protein
VSTYVEAVAPLIAWQLPPDALQRCHSREYPVGPPAQDPSTPVKVDPWIADPLIDGPVVLAGGPAATAPVAAERAVVVPTAFVALTSTRMNFPTSAIVST